MWKLNNTDEVLPIALLGMTAVTGIVDAVSFLALGHVFTANMTGNLVILGFAVPQAPGVSIAGSLAALAAFFVGFSVPDHCVHCVSHGYEECCVALICRQAM